VELKTTNSADMILVSPLCIRRSAITFAKQNYNIYFFQEIFNTASE